MLFAPNWGLLPLLLLLILLTNKVNRRTSLILVARLCAGLISFVAAAGDDLGSWLNGIVSGVSEYNTHFSHWDLHSDTGRKKVSSCWGYSGYQVLKAMYFVFGWHPMAYYLFLEYFQLPFRSVHILPIVCVVLSNIYILAYVSHVVWLTVVKKMLNHIPALWHAKCKYNSFSVQRHFHGN